MKKVVAIKKKWTSYKQKKKIIKEVDLIGKGKKLWLRLFKNSSDDINSFSSLSTGVEC